MRLKTMFTAIAAIGLFAGTAAAQEGTLKKIKDTGTITIGHRDTSIPFSYYDDKQQVVGYAIDICMRIVDAVKTELKLPKLDVKFNPVTSATRIPLMANGTIDLECGSTTNNTERRERVAFTVPHYITGARYLVRTDSPISELKDFEKKRLVITKGTTPMKAIAQANKERLLGIQIVEVPDHARGVEMVEKGAADGFAMDDVLLYGLKSDRPNPAALKVVGRFLTIEPLAIMLSKEDPEFKRIVDQEMKRLIASREAYAIYDRWFLQPIPPKSASLNMPMNYLLKDFWKYPTDQVPN